MKLEVTVERCVLFCSLLITVWLLFDKYSNTSPRLLITPILQQHDRRDVVRLGGSRSLLSTASRSTAQQKQLLSQRSTGIQYHCTEEEMLYQQSNFELTGIFICDRDNIWQLMHLTLPDAKVFLDVGGNLGYSAARIFGLWSPGHQFNRTSLYRAILNGIKLNLTTNEIQWTTYCNDHKMKDIPLICFGHEHHSEVLYEQCPTRRNISVYSFDGQKSHVDNQRRVVYHHFPHLHPEYNRSNYNHTSHVFPRWEYIHAALTDSIPFNNTAKIGYFVKDNSEIGSLIKNTDEFYRSMKGVKKLPALLEVPLLTIDDFAKQRQLEQIDIIKIDAEGEDVSIIHGALESLQHRNVKVLTFECQECLLREKYESLYRDLDEKYGFDCYLNGINQLVVKMTGNCWDYNRVISRPTCAGKRCPAFVRMRRAKSYYILAIDSNAYCVHRTRAVALYTILESMALYHYSDPERQGHFFKDGFVSVPQPIQFMYEANRSDFELPYKNKQWYYRMYGRDNRTGERFF